MRKYLVVLLAAVMLCFSAAAFAEKKAYELPEEVVTGEEVFEDKTVLTPGSVTVIKPQEMQGEQKNLPELLKRVPGLHVIESHGRGAYTIASVRGSTSSQVSVFVDGTLMNLASEAAVDLTTIPVDNVERIEVYRGYIPARFAGASMGGVINIITKKPVKQEGQLSVGAGSFGKIESNLSYSTKLGEGKFFFGANLDRSDGDFKYHNDGGTTTDPSDDYEAKRHNNGYKNKDFLLKWNNSEWQLRASYKDNYRELPREASGADDPEIPKTLLSGTQDTEQYVFSAGRRFKSGNLDWGIKLDYLDQHKEYDNPLAPGSVGGGGEKHNEYDTQRIGFALDGALPVGERQLIEFLGDYSNEEMDVAGDVLEAIQSQLDKPISFFRREAYNLQLQDTITLDKSGSFWFTPIIRYNYMDGDGSESWGAALTKKLNDSWKLKATGGTYNRAPNLYEKYGDGACIRPSTDLKWEEGTQWDFGIEYTGKVKDIDLYADLTYFGRHSDNMIEFFMLSPRYGKYYNVGKAEVNGVEFETKAIWEKWELFASATYMRAISKTDTQLESGNGDSIRSFNYSSGKRLPNRPRYEGLVRLSRKMYDDKVSAFAELHYHGSNYFGSTEDVLMEKYLTTDLGFNWRINDSFKLNAGVEDIFDETSDLMFKPTMAGLTKMMYFPLQGRTFYVTLTWLF